jgi:hypothetical protein
MKIFLNIAKFLPAVLSGVVAVEATIAGEAKGTAKKQILIDAISTAAKVGESVSDSDIALISGLIDATVGTLNATGLFTKSTPAATPAV